MRQQTVRLLATSAIVLAAVVLRPAPALAVAQVTAAPGTVMPGDSTMITASCAPDAIAASLSARSLGDPSPTPMARDADKGPGAFSAAVTIPAGTLPGTYDLSVTCNTGESGVGTVIVASSGGPATGDGSTSTGANRSLLLGGLLMLLIAAGGALMLRRRSTG